MTKEAAPHDCVLGSVRRTWQWAGRTFSPTFKAACIAAGALIVVHLWIVPAAIRQQKRLDEKYASITEVAELSGEYYQGIWNVYFGIIGKEDAEALRWYRDQVQKASARASGVGIKLSMLFSDPAIAQEWKQAMKIYHDAHYPLGRPEERGKINEEYEKLLNEKLRPADPLLESMIEKMQAEL